MGVYHHTKNQDASSQTTRAQSPLFLQLHTRSAFVVFQFAQVAGAPSLTRGACKGPGPLAEKEQSVLILSILRFSILVCCVVFVVLFSTKTKGESTMEALSRTHSLYQE